MPDESVDMIVTDPAYNSMNAHLKLGRGRIVGDYKTKEQWFTEFDDSQENYTKFLRECKRVMRPDRPIYIMFDSFSLLKLGHLVENTFSVKNIIVWDKCAIGTGYYFRRQHELIMFASKGKVKIENRGLSDMWKVKRVSKPVYPTQKPVEIFNRMLSASARDNYTILDPFMGSGSSLIAAAESGYNYIGFDISRKAIDISVQRLTEMPQCHNKLMLDLEVIY